MKKSLIRWMLLLILICIPVLFWRITHDQLVKDKQQIVIGTHLPLTGTLASVGLEQKWAYETSVNDINAAGGIYVREHGKRLPVKIVVLDDETDPAKAALSVKRLIDEEKVDLILGGHAASSGVIAGCITAEKYQKYYHATAAFSPPWLEHNFKWSTLLFFDIEQAASVPFQIWNSLSPEKRPKRAALFMEDTFGGKAFGKAFKENAGKFGYEFVLDIALDASEGNYLSQLKQAKALNVDAILFHASVDDCILLVQNMKALNFGVKYLHGWKGTWAKEFWQSLGKDALYILSDGFWSKDNAYAGSRELGERYYKVFGSESISVGAFYATSQILWKAIEKAGTLDSEKVRKAVLNTQFDTVLGPIQYDNTGVGVYPSSAFQRRADNLVPVYYMGLTNHPLKLALPRNDRHME